MLKITTILEYSQDFTKLLQEALTHPAFQMNKELLGFLQEFNKMIDKLNIKQKEFGNDYESLELNSLIFLRASDMLLFLMNNSSLKPVYNTTLQKFKEIFSREGTFNSVILNANDYLAKFSIEREKNLKEMKNSKISSLSDFEKEKKLKDTVITSYDLVKQIPKTQDEIMRVNEICKNILEIYDGIISKYKKFSANTLEASTADFFVLFTKQRELKGLKRIIHTNKVFTIEETIQREYNFFKKLESYPYFPKTFSYTNEYFIMEYFPLGKLTDYLHAQPPYPIVNNLSNQLTMCYHIAKALAYLDDNNIIHGDLKPENILIKVVNNEGYPVIVDFGASRHEQEDLQNLGLNLLFAAPETLLDFYKGSYQTNKKSDWYALSLTLSMVILLGNYQLLRDPNRSSIKDHALFVNKIKNELLEKSDAIISAIITNNLFFSPEARKLKPEAMSKQLQERIKVHKK